MVALIVGIVALVFSLISLGFSLYNLLEARAALKAAEEFLERLP